MKAMILAAGLGTRLKPITDTIPKALLPIGGKPLIARQLEKLREAGINDVVINLHHFPEQIRQYCATHDFGLNITFSDESEQLLETGGGLRKAAPLLQGAIQKSEIRNQNPEPVLVCNVDILSNIDLCALIAAHHPDDLATIVVSERNTQRYFLFDVNGLLHGWTNIATGEKRPATLMQSQVSCFRKLAFSGMHIVSPEIFPILDTYPEKFSITDFYIGQCSTHRIRAYQPENYHMMDIGKIDHLQEAEDFAKTLDSGN